MHKILVLLCLIVLACTSSKMKETVHLNPNNNYSKYCAGCHGKNGESFRTRNFKYGDSQKEIYASIKNGIEAAGMPAYKQTFNEDELQNLSKYIKELAALPKIIPNNKTIFQSQVVNLQIDTITMEVDVPWSIEFLPDNTMLISDRDGDLYHRYNDGKMVKVLNVPQVHNHGQGGLLDILVHPDYDANKRVYISYSKPVKKEGRSMSTTAIIMAKFENDALKEVKEIFEATPYFESNYHFGCRMVLDKNKFLYFTVGERGRENINPQDLSSMCGKVHRLKDDGSLPLDNPFIGVENAQATIYSYGHRNPQGIDIQDETGDIWVNEHGPKGGDEINISKPKLNFGWPLTTFGINYNGTKITDNTTLPGITDPIHFWVPSIGPSDGMFVRGDLYGEWKGDYLVPSLSFGYLHRCIVKGNKVVRSEKLLEDIGRMRSIKQDNLGFIYIGLENPGRVLRVRPLW